MLKIAKFLSKSSKFESLKVSAELIRNMSSSKYKVFVTRSDYPECGLELLKPECDLTIWKNTSITHDDILNNVAGTNAIFCCLNEKMNKEVLDKAGDSLKVISTMSVGFDHIDRPECKKRGIKIGYTPGVLTDATAELTVSILLAASRRIPEAIHEAKSGGWKSWAPTYMTGPGLSGATVGIFGFGRIGQAIARRVKGFNTKRILYCNRSVKPEAKETGATKVEFDQLLKESDFVICCVAYAPEMKELFNKEAFSKMKRTAVFVNSSRGAIVDQPALVEALKNKIIFGAGLDVTTPEPLPLDHELFKLPNCVIVPHIGSATIDTRNTMSNLVAQNILAALKGQKMPAELS